MRDSVVEPSERRPIARLGELQAFQFICDAVRAGEQAILVTCDEHVPARAPQGVLAACASASTRTLHIRPPLPEPPELQEMIGAAVGIAGGSEMAPLAMAARLLFTDPRQTVILAVDDAHTLSDRSLSYLMQMIELLEPDAPALQIVLAAKPALLDTLARPEFERLQSILCRPKFEAFQTSRWGNGDEAPASAHRDDEGLAQFELAEIKGDGPAAVPDSGRARSGRGPRPLAVYATLGTAAAGCLAAIGYFAIPLFAGGAAPWPVPWLGSAAPRPPAPSNPPPLAQPGAADHEERAPAAQSAAAPEGASDRNADAAPPAARVEAPATPSPSAEQRAAESEAARSPSAAAPAPLRAAAPARIADAAPSAKTETPPPSPALPPEQSASAGEDERAAPARDAASLIAPSAEPRRIVEPPSALAKAAPTAPADLSSIVVAGLPTLAPVRVVLNVPRDRIEGRRVADVKQALAAAGLEVSDLVSADAQRPGPSVGYYFESDRSAATGVSRLLEPLLGAVDPVALRRRGSIPEPGTIEIAIP